MRIINSLLPLILCAMIALTAWATHRDIELVVSPHVLQLKSKSPPHITIHAKIPFDEVVLSSVYLHITAADGSTTVLHADEQHLFADACGDLVAKFESEQVKGAIQPPQAIFLVEMDTMDGSGFSSWQEVKVR